MAKRRPRPDEPDESRQLVALGHMLQDSFACVKGERPEKLRDRAFGWGFNLSFMSLILADFIRPYLGTTQMLGPLKIVIPQDFGWTNTAGSTLEFTMPIVASFRRFAALEIECYKAVIRSDGLTLGLRWQPPLGLPSVSKEVNFPFDLTSPN